MDQRLLSIYIGNEVIRIVDATKKSNTSIIINSVDEVSTPNGCVDDGYITDTIEVASAIRSKIIGKASKAKAVFTVSSKKIASKEVVIPYVKGEKKIASVLNANSSEYFPMSTTGDFVFAHNVMETFMDEEGKKYRINAVCAPKDLIDCYYDVADELKLTVQDIDYVGNSVQQLLKLQMSTNEDDTNLVLQIEKDATFVNVMAGRDIILQRSVPYGKNAVINSIMEIKKLTEKEAVELLKDKDRMDRRVTEEEYSEAVRYLISSIGRIVEYHRSRNPERIIDGIKVFGEGASIAGIDEVLKQELGAEVTRFNTLNGIKVSQKSYLSSDQALRFLACFGAVLNPIGLKVDQGKNREAQSANINKLLIALIVLAALVMISISAYVQIKFMLKKVDVEFKKSQIAEMEIAEQVANRYEETLNAYNIVKSFTDTTHSNNVMLTTLISDLENKVLTKNTTINDLAADDGTVSFTVTTHSKEEIADFIINLKKLDYVTDYTITTVTETYVELYDADGNLIKYTFVNGVAYDEAGNEISADMIEGSSPYDLGGSQTDTYDVKLTLVDPDYVVGEVEEGIDPSAMEGTTAEEEIGGLE